MSQVVLVDRDPHPVLDGVGWVVEAADMVTVFAAHRFRRTWAYVRETREDALRDASMDRALADRSVRLELAAALRVTEYAAGRLMLVAEALAVRYPEVLDCLDRAETTVAHAEHLVDELDGIDDPRIRDRIYPQATAAARELPMGTFRRTLRRLIDTETADQRAQRHERALTQRRVWVEPAPDSMAWLSALVPAVEARAIHNRMTALATALTDTDDDRTIDQRRADVLCDLLIDGETASLPDALRGIRPTVAVTCPVLTLLGHPGAGPGVVDGVGPIPDAVARALAGAADGWMRVLTHPETGTVLSVGRTLYRPPAALRRLVRWRSPRCVAPGCGMPADRCDLDHTIAWEHGGHTAADNLAPACRGHHILKHHTRWRIEPLGGGTMQWTSPSGRRYLVEPERRTPAFTPAPPGTPSDPEPDTPPF
ncbi:DUF222 domain-containing protein [Microbacterium sp.]|uniref:HNH endonuclease signature motif containing protein n=1 Tax=Microbacterium sp. TaxID=51671 RepID=UPI003A855AAD